MGKTKPTRDEKALNEIFLENRGRSVFQASSAWRQTELEPDWLKEDDAYNSRFPNEKNSKKLRNVKKLFIPKTYSHTQRILVDVLDAYFSDVEEIVDVASWKSVPYESRKIVKSLLNYRLNSHPIDFYSEAYDAALDALTHKIGIMKVFPKFTLQADGRYRYDPQIHTLPYEDTFFHANATWKDYWKHPVVHRFKKSRDWAKRRGFINLDRIEGGNAEAITDQVKTQRSYHSGSPFKDEGMVTVANAQEITFFEIWDFLDVNGDGFLQSCSYVMAGDASPTVLVRDVKENRLPYQIEGEDYNRCPIFLGNALPEPHLLAGKSIPIIVDGLQRETNAQRNQVRELTAMAMRKPTLVAKSAGIDYAGLLNRKMAGIIKGDNVSQEMIREMEVSPPPANYVQEHQITGQEFFEVTSIPPDLQGATTLREDTATGVNSRVTNANKKIAHIVRNLTYTLFLPVFRALLRLEQEFVSDEFVALVTGRALGWGFPSDGFPPREVIQGEFDLAVNVGLNKQAQFNRLAMLLERGNQVNQMTGFMLQSGVVRPEAVHFVNTMELFHRMIPLAGEQNIESLMIGAQQPPVDGGGTGVGSPPATRPIQNEGVA
jgi:hypothetical protein